MGDNVNRGVVLVADALPSNQAQPETRFQRGYDVSVVQKINALTQVVTLEGGETDGLELEIRPVPDGIGGAELDPRVIARAEAKAAAKAAAAAAGPDILPHGADFLTWREDPNKETRTIDSLSVTERVEEVRLPDHSIYVRVFEPAPQEEPARPLVAFFHGGGFCVGNIGQYRNSLRLIAELSGSTVIYPEYRLAPECPFPGGLDDCVAAVEWARAHAAELHADADRVVLVGDSAGGSLVDGAAIRLSDQGCVKTCVVMYPLVSGRPVPEAWGEHLYPVHPEQADIAKSRIMRFYNGAETLVDAYLLGDMEGLKNPEVCAMELDDYSVLPRMVIITADYDYLRYDAEVFATKLQAAGHDVRAVRYAGCDHGFFETCGVMPQVEDVCRLIAWEVLRV